LARDALVLIDIVNPLDFDGADRLVASMRRMHGPLSRLLADARRCDVPVVWVNDHHDQWSASLEELVRSCSEGPLSEVLRDLQPLPGEPTILKPRHSGFFQTSLASLLEQLDVDRLVLAGVQAHICVLFTAHDAHMRGYRVAMPRDVVAAETEADVEAALHIVERVLGADTAPADELRWRTAPDRHRQA
jgi:nicotinamidase-related amidase